MKRQLEMMMIIEKSSNRLYGELAFESLPVQLLFYEPVGTTTSSFYNCFVFPSRWNRPFVAWVSIFCTWIFEPVFSFFGDFPRFSDDFFADGRTFYTGPYLGDSSLANTVSTWRLQNLTPRAESRVRVALLSSLLCMLLEWSRWPSMTVIIADFRRQKEVY